MYCEHLWMIWMRRSMPFSPLKWALMKICGKVSKSISNGSKWTGNWVLLRLVVHRHLRPVSKLSKAHEIFALFRMFIALWIEDNISHNLRWGAHEIGQDFEQLRMVYKFWSKHAFTHNFYRNDQPSANLCLNCRLYKALSDYIKNSSKFALYQVLCWYWA